MKREELLKSKEYWIGEIQLELFKFIENYMKKNNLSRKQFANKLGVTKGYVSQILNGEFDHRISKFVELSLAIGKVPRVDFCDIEQIIYLDELNELHTRRYNSLNIELKFDANLGISKSVQEQSQSKSFFSMDEIINLKPEEYFKYETKKEQEIAE